VVRPGDELLRPSGDEGECGLDVGEVRVGVSWADFDERRDGDLGRGGAGFGSDPVGRARKVDDRVGVGWGRRREGQGLCRAKTGSRSVGWGFALVRLISGIR
jgi:hypothetical protein